MSWNIQLAGPALDVAAEVAKDQYLPQPLKDAAQMFATANVKNNPKAALIVTSSGHYDENYGGYIYEFKIIQANMPPPLPAPTAAEPAPATNGG